MPIILVLCPNCRSHVLSPSTLSLLNPLYTLLLLLLLLMPSSLNPTPFYKYLYVMVMDICLYALTFSLTPIHAMLSVYMIFYILSNVYCF
jgi:hypothetical protein